MTKGDVSPADSLEHKLTELGAGLTDEERSVFVAILAIAATADDPEVAGLAMRRPRGAITRDAELSMLDLQSFVSQRALAIQLTSNMMMSMNDSTNSIVKNIRG
jgi:hypothetical protein